LECGLGRVFVSLLETGKQQPTFETMLKLALGLGCKALDIVEIAEALVDDEDWGAAA
jgi:transcriptional regulator with XRE-family HTH domain